jgi:type VI secretion system ImpA family protein
MAMDVEALLAPVSEDQPCGPDLSLEPQRRALERLIANATSVEFDSNTGQPKPAPEINWAPVIGDIVEQFAHTKDIGLAVYLCRAGALGKQLDAVAQGAAVLSGLLERYWEQVHPSLDSLGMLGRSTPCDSLAHRASFLGPLERVPILAHPRLGIFAGVDLHRFRKNGEAESDFGPFRHTLSELGDAPLKAADALFAEIDAALHQASATFASKTDGQGSLNFKPTYAVLAELRKSLGSFFVTPVAAPAGELEEAGSAVPPAPRGALDSRDDVLRALDAIADYYRRREPSSPILPFLERAKAWVPMSFIDILEDIAPESLTAAKLVLTKRPRA